MIWLRSALFNAWFFGATAAIGLFGVGVRWLAPQRALGVARSWARLVLGGARVICGMGVELTGLDRLPDGPVLIASQHQSAFDTLIWATLLPRFSYVYKAELERIPLFGPMLPAAGQIAVERRATVASVRRLLAAASAAKAAGRQIVIFPEGTRVAHGSLVDVRGGFGLIAARAGLPIIPVATDSGRYWGRRSFRKYPGRIKVVICEPLPPGLPPAELATRLKASWAAALHVDNSVDDPAARPAPLGQSGVAS